MEPGYKPIGRRRVLGAIVAGVAAVGLGLTAATCEPEVIDPGTIANSLETECGYKIPEKTELRTAPYTVINYYDSSYELKRIVMHDHDQLLMQWEIRTGSSGNGSINEHIAKNWRSAGLVKGSSIDLDRAFVEINNLEERRVHQGGDYWTPIDLYQHLRGDYWIPFRIVKEGQLTQEDLAQQEALKMTLCQIIE